MDSTSKASTKKHKKVVTTVHYYFARMVATWGPALEQPVEATRDYEHKV